jgi:hypothetical protein
MHRFIKSVAASLQKARTRRSLKRRQRYARLNVEALEGRVVPSNAPQILETVGTNPRPPFDTSNPNWASDLVGGVKFPFGAKWEWTPALNPRSEIEGQVTQISGTAINPGISGDDLEFVHPFGHDFEFFIAPDPQYTSLLARTNRRPPSGPVTRSNCDRFGIDGEYCDAIAAADGMGLPQGVPGVLGDETDQGLVPAPYRPQHGDRVAVLGRWIVDAGHEDFHTEIHPPRMIATARNLQGSTEWTTSTIVGRPYLVSQEFLLGDTQTRDFLNKGNDDGATLEHGLKEIKKILGIDCPWYYFGLPCSTRAEFHPGIRDQSTLGLSWMLYYVRPEAPREDPGDTLVTSFHFTVRDGVQVDVIPPLPGRDEVLVSVLMNPSSNYRQAPLPHKTEVTVYDFPAAPWLAFAAQALGLLPADPRLLYAAAVLGQGELTDRYDTPTAASVYDSQNVVENLPVRDLWYPRPTPVSVDNSASQPFPVYGYLNVGWQRAARTLTVSTPNNTPAGTPFLATVTAKDRLGNIATNYRGTVHFTNTDAAADLPADYTFTAADNGVHTFPVTLRRAGSHTLTVTDTAKPSLAGSAAVRELQSFSVNNGDLTVYADQLATLDLSGTGGVLVNLNGQVAQYDPGSIRSMSVYGGVGANTINVWRTAPSMPVYVYGGGGRDVVNVGNAVNGVQGIQGPLAISNPHGSTSLTVNDAADSTARIVTLSGKGNISGLAPAAVTYTPNDLSDLTIFGGSGGNTFTVPSTAAAPAATLSAGAGNNTVNVGNAANTLDDILGALIVNGQGGNTVLNLNNQGEGYPNSWSYNLYADRVEPSRGGTRPFTLPPLSYRGVQRLVLNADNGTNLFLVWGTAAGTQVTINGGTIGNIIQAPLDYTGRNTWRLTGPGAGTLNSIVTFTAMHQLLGSFYGNEVFAFSPGGSILELSGSPYGSGTLDFSAYDQSVTVSLANWTYSGVAYQGKVPGVINGFNAIQTILGTPGANTLIGPNAATAWTLKGPNAGDVGNVHFSGFANLVGGSGADVFRFHDGGSVSGNIDGGGGTNTLDYAAYSDNVLVNLQTGTATGVGDSIANIQNVTGANGGPVGSYNLLVGNGGNVLTGGTGRRNLLIAGAAASTLLGGDDEDLLIGGTTAYDTDLASLLAIMAEWTRTDEDYDTRVFNLTHGIGVPLLDATTVLGNGGGNTLRGGPGRDLFFGNLSLDTSDWDPLSETFISV